MGVKLLSKSLVAEQKVRQQARDVAEGLKVANRVDALRENYSRTEQELEKYRNATLAEIQKEISALAGEKEKLAGDVRTLRMEYDAMLPEIATKRPKLAAFEKSLMKWEAKLEKREENAGLLELDVQEAKQKAEFSRARAEDDERIAINRLVKADRQGVEADATLQNAKNIFERAETVRKDNEAAFVLREYSIKSKESELLIMQTKLINEKKELAKEWIKVKDQRETLERSIARLRAGRQP